MAIAFAASVTPGPNNALITANAAANGWRAIWPHMLGDWGRIAMAVLLVVSM